MRTYVVAALMAVSSPASADAPVAPAKPLMKQDSLNVYRRFPAEAREATVRFYRDGLGLTPAPSISPTPGLQVLIFRIGSGQVKLAPGLKPGREYHPGSPKAATGIRLYGFTYGDEKALVARLAAIGVAAPRFAPRGDGTRAALVTDPAGFPVELIVKAGAGDPSPGVEVGIAVSDLGKARAFYEGFAGLDPLPPAPDRVIGVTRTRFRHGETVVSLWPVARGVPHDTGSAGIQYVTGNVEAVAALATERKVTVEEPLGGLPGFPLKTIWLNDPDGATNYFYQLMTPAAPPAVK